MKTLLVPVDFTPASENTVNFAGEWSKRYEYTRIILLKTFYNSIYESIIVSAEYSNINQDYLNNEREEASEQLNQLCKRLAKQAGAAIQVTTAVSELPLLRSIIEVIHNEKPDLILLGADNNSDLDRGLVAENIISIAKASPIRLLIVPSNYKYRPVKQALLPYNFNMLDDLDKLNSLRTAPQWKDLKLKVLNIDTNQRIIKLNEKFKEAEDKFQKLLKNFPHEIYYTTDKNVINGINNFTKEHDTQLIIALPGKYSFLYTLTHKSISEAIYRNAQQPVLILK